MEIIIRQWHLDAIDLLDYLPHVRDIGCRPIIGPIIENQLETEFDIASTLDKACENLLVKTCLLRTIRQDQLSPRLEYAYAELPKFELDGLPVEFWPAFEALIAQMRYWVRDVSRERPLTEKSFDLESLAAFKNLQSKCPFTDERCIRLKTRIRLENSRLIRDLKVFPIVEGEPLVLGDATEGKRVSAAVTHPASTTNDAEPESNARGRAGVNPKKISKGKEANELTFVSALTNHHKYENGSVLNFDPIALSGTGLSKGSASRRFKKHFGDYSLYVQQCKNNRIITALKMLNREISPKLLNERTQIDESRSIVPPK